MALIHHTKVLLDRAAALQHAGEWHPAVALFEEAFVSSVRDAHIDDAIESVLRIGYSYRQLADADLAIEYFDLVFVLASLHSDYGRASRALNGMAIVSQERGYVDEAEQNYLQARDYAERANDVLTVGSIDQNLGTLANIRGDLESALRHYQSGLACYEAINHKRGIAGVLNNLGMLQIDRAELDAASRSLERALEVSRDIDDVATEGIVHINRTELFLALGQPDQARTSCDDAYEIASRLNDNSCRSEALKFYGIIYRETGKFHLAEIHLKQAIEIAAQYNIPLTEAESHRELALALRAQNRNHEALNALNHAHTLFSSLQAVHDQADVAKRVVQLEEDFISLVRVWGESIEAKDKYTSGHCQRVADYACRIATEIGFPESDMVWFRMGAFLHDVGKTEVPAAILNKPGRLTDDERLLMEQHTVIGDQILAPIPFPWDIRPMVRSHHERWDGRGYPDGLIGESIPLTARILRLADIFDALTTTRSYRDPLTPEQAFQLMLEDHGSFDPYLFDVFQGLFPEFRRSLEDNELIRQNATA